MQALGGGLGEGTAGFRIIDSEHGCRAVVVRKIQLHCCRSLMQIVDDGIPTRNIPRAGGLRRSVSVHRHGCCEVPAIPHLHELSNAGVLDIKFLGVPAEVHVSLPAVQPSLAQARHVLEARRRRWLPRILGSSEELWFFLLEPPQVLARVALVGLVNDCDVLGLLAVQDRVTRIRHGHDGRPAPGIPWATRPACPNRACP
mmetsp:Transcript_69196/g.175874  ORF Transcript_69196/g.175874 Transcript_69196/m.175874 type:complete len:200 (+) Transcript_69196:931-1530(+)